jgi:hypothetical protein
MLATIGSFLSKSGVKATNDNPTMQRLVRSFADLPFKDEPSAPSAYNTLTISPRPKDQH